MLRFLMRLALAQGKTLAELQNSLGYIEGIPEEYWWLAFYSLEPFGNEWLQTGTLAALTANQWSKRKLTPEDFLPVAKRRAEAQSPKVQEAMFRAAVAHLGIVDQRPR